jgi:Ca2+-binding RTX toxin-like protein
MIYRSFLRLAYIVMAGLILFSMIFAIAANNVVPVTYLTDQSTLVTANDLKPAACSAIILTAIRYCPTTGGACPGTDPDASELVIGSTADDDIESGKGDDCILGGGGNDSIRGEQNTDICIGGSGTDSFHPSCETQTQ